MRDALARTAAVALMGSVTLMPLLVLPMMVGAYVDHLGLDESQAGWLASASFLGASGAALTLSLRMHRLNLRRLATLGLVLMLLSDACSAFAGSWPLQWLTMARFVSGVGSGMAYGAVMASYACWREPDRAYGLFMAMQFLVSAVGLLLLPLWLPDVGVKGLFLGFAALDLLALSLVASLSGSSERAVHLRPDVMEWRMILGASALFCLFGIGLFETANMAQFTYSERLGVSFALGGEQIGQALAAGSVLGVPAAFSVTLIGSRFGYYRPLLFAIGLQISALLLLLSPLGGDWFLPAMCLMGVGWAMSLPYFQAIAAGLDRGGSVVVACGFATAMGGFMGPAGAAMLVGEGHYRTMLLAVIICLLLSNALARLVTLRLPAA